MSICLNGEVVNFSVFLFLKLVVDKTRLYDYNYFCVKRESAGIGRQARLRGVCHVACGFKSHLSHQLKSLENIANRNVLKTFLF